MQIVTKDMNGAVCYTKLFPLTPIAIRQLRANSDVADYITKASVSKP